MAKYVSLLLTAVLFICLLPGCASFGSVTDTGGAVVETGTSDTPLLSLSAERVAKIEEEWQNSPLCAWAKDAAFCQPDSKQDGIRYYGSYTITTPDETITYDILYLPCGSLPVPTQITLGCHTFRSRTAFTLLIFSSKKLEALGIEMSTFYPLTIHAQPEGGDSAIWDEVHTALATAEALHNTYETLLYGSYLKTLPAQNPGSEEMQVQAAWLVHNGRIPQFFDNGSLRYYGHFDGCGIVFEATQLQALSRAEIAGQTFTHNTSFALYACVEGTFMSLKEAYESGIIHSNSIKSIAKIHQNAEG